MVADSGGVRARLSPRVGRLADVIGVCVFGSRFMLLVRCCVVRGGVGDDGGLVFAGVIPWCCELVVYPFRHPWTPLLWGGCELLCAMLTWGGQVPSQTLSQVCLRQGTRPCLWWCLRHWVPTDSGVYEASFS